MILWLHGVKRFMYGKSTLDQRIEARRGVLKKLGIHWWINLFKDIGDTGMFDLDNPVVKKCLQFSSWTSCKLIWIEQRITEIIMKFGHRDDMLTCLLENQADILYFGPELTDGPDLKTLVSAEDVNVCFNLYGKKELVAKSSKNL